MSADVRRLNGLDAPADVAQAGPQPAKRSPRRTLAQIGAQDAASSEHEAQRAVVEAVARYAQQRPALRLLYAIPNGGKRHVAVAVKLKAEGVKAGVPDLCLPVARGGYHGCYLEGKRKGGHVSAAQLEWLTALALEGYYVTIFWSADQGIDTLLKYERGELKR